MQWANRGGISPKQFICGYCGNIVASNEGFSTQDYPGGHQAFVYICPNCTEPSYFHIGKQIPGVAPGNKVAHLPHDIDALYLEARRAVSVGAYTASVLACRKLLMNIAVSQGAIPGESFLSYVEYLAKAGYVPPNGRGWVDHIRSKGNEATHEIKVMSSDDAIELISFSEMLLKFIFEFPNKVPGKTN